MSDELLVTHSPYATTLSEGYISIELLENRHTRECFDCAQHKRGYP